MTPLNVTKPQGEGKCPGRAERPNGTSFLPSVGPTCPGIFAAQCGQSGTWQLSSTVEETTFSFGGKG